MTDESASRARRVAFLVRSHDPSPAACARLADWAEQIAGYNNNVQGEVVDMWVSVDASARARQGAEEESASARIAREFEGRGLRDHVRTHEYTERDMGARYSVLEEEMRQDTTIAKVREIRTGQFSLAWGFHCAAVNVWYQALTSEHKYDFVWVWEDDVGFSGDVALLLQRYRACDDDLLADTIRPLSAQWFWATTTSASYATAIPMAERSFAKEHVQRLSRRLLDELDRLAREERFIAWSEQSVPSVCRYKGMVAAPLDADFVGRHFSWDSRIDEKTWARFCSAKSPRPRNKLYHALKF